MRKGFVKVFEAISQPVSLCIQYNMEVEISFIVHLLEYNPLC